jgi:cbb3-type cytochrome oxidase cytochrome c subunit
MSAWRPILVAAGVALTLARAVSAQEAGGGFTTDPTMAKKGQSLWNNRGCVGCHAFGAKRSGPDLAGVLERREHDWVRRFLTNPTEMLQSDSIAMALLAEYNNTKMPNMRLKPDEIEALMHYIAQETAKVRGSSGSD